MTKLVAGLALSLLLSPLAAPAAAQQPERLTVGRSVARTLAVGESHGYSLAIDSGRFVRGEAVQDGIDLQVIVLSPKGDTIARYDSPNGTEGPEPFRFTTTAGGEFRIIIAPSRRPRAPAGTRSPSPGSSRSRPRPRGASTS